MNHRWKGKVSSSDLEGEMQAESEALHPASGLSRVGEVRMESV